MLVSFCNFWLCQQTRNSEWTFSWLFFLTNMPQHILVCNWILTLDNFTKVPMHRHYLTFPILAQHKTVIRMSEFLRGWRQHVSSDRHDTVPLQSNSGCYMKKHILCYVQEHKSSQLGLFCRHYEDNPVDLYHMLNHSLSEQSFNWQSGIPEENLVYISSYTIKLESKKQSLSRSSPT